MLKEHSVESFDGKIIKYPGSEENSLQEQDDTHLESEEQSVSKEHYNDVTDDMKDVVTHVYYVTDSSTFPAWVIPFMALCLVIVVIFVVLVLY